MNGDDNMSVLAVPCNKPIIVTKEEGERILKMIESNKLSNEQKGQIILQAKKLWKR